MCGEKDTLSSQARYHCTSNRGGKLSCRKAQRCKVSCRSQVSNYHQSRNCKAGFLGIFWLDVRAARCGLSCVILRASIPFLPTLWDGRLMLHTQWKESPFPDCWVPDSVLCFKLNNTQYEESISGCPCCFQAPTLFRFTWTILAICFQAGFLYYGLWSLPDLIHSLVLTQYNWNLISFPGTEPGNFFLFLALIGTHLLVCISCQQLWVTALTGKPASLLRVCLSLCKRGEKHLFSGKDPQISNFSMSQISS